MTLPPCLVITSIEILDERVAAELQIGPRLDQMVLDLSRIDLIYGFIKMPRVLDPLQRPQRAVIDLLVQVYRGADRPPLPLDLSHLTRERAEPWPAFEFRDEPPQPSLQADVSKVEHDTPEHGLETVYLDVLGVPTQVIVDDRDRRERPRASTLFRFVEGVHPLQLDDAGSLAMFHSINKAIEGGVSL